MNKEFINALDEIERSKGISKSVVIEALEKALEKSYEKNFEEHTNVEVHINSESGEIKIFALKTVVDKVEDELTKKQNREQTSGYCKYIKTNLVRISKMIADLENETKTLIEQIQASKGVKLSFREKGDFR